MKILITGASGLIGKHLIRHVLDRYQTYQVSVLTRDKNKNKFDSRVNVFEWDPYNNYLEPGSMDSVTHLVHLAGESVADDNWSDFKKKEILKSRVIPTRFLKEKIATENITVKFICASAIGIYGDRKDEILDTDSALGGGFLANVCKEWEKEALTDLSKGSSCSLRIGIVLSQNGGALKQMLPYFKKNLGAVIGNGEQYMSWIHIDDLVDQIMFLIHNDIRFSIYNGVSNSPVTNKEFSNKLASALNRKSFFKAPKFALKLLFGDMSKIMTNSQRVVPSNFLKEGFNFKYNDLDKALSDIIESKK